ncbi:MAG TPA: FAD-dependent monooxygenase [Gammaproteobacteria bacterium]|nr:FAD-dependent monooxygenase [Gammaproteobacteria bacterium]
MTKNVLIVGAGPTGLVLALWLTKLGIPLRIIDKNQDAEQNSRAMIIHARTLEFYQQIGIAHEIVANGIIIEKINLWKNRQRLTSIYLGAFGKNLSPFPFLLSLPQDDHEKLLIHYLKQAGIEVERNTELVSLSQNDEKVTAFLKKENETEMLECAFLLGCDGASSTVRHALNIDFSGGTYSQLYYVADVMAEGNIANEDIHVNLHRNEFAIVFPVRSSGSLRLIGIVPKQYENKKNIQFDDVKSHAIQNTGLTISKVNWFSTYHSHHRVAEHFKKGRVFLLGDAAHIHSPVGGQGMNTGIGDAVNLSWKIASVIKKSAPFTILDTYETERMAFARRLVSTTDRAFQAITNIGLIGNFVRNIFFPIIFPFLTRFDCVKKFLFQTISQIKINYHHSALSSGKSGKIQGGDRLPWIRYNKIDNYQFLTHLDWQIHIYGTASNTFKKSIEHLNIKLHEFSWGEPVAQAGLKKNSIYLIRPDGYVGYTNSLQKCTTIKNYFGFYQEKKQCSG